MSALEFLCKHTAKDEENFAQRGRGGGLLMSHMEVLAEDLIQRYLDTNGDGTGTKNAIGDYSSGTTSFKITATAGYDYVLHEVIIWIRDSGAFSADEYGNLTALSNGVIVRVTDAVGNEIHELTDGVPIQSVACWGRFTHELLLDDFGSGDNFISSRWPLHDKLVLREGQSLEFVMRDDLQGLVGHYFFVHGRRRIP